MKSILDNWRPYQFSFYSDSQNFWYCTKKSRNFSHAPTSPTKDVEKYSQIMCILICIECNLFDGGYVFWNSTPAFFLWQPKHKVA